MSEQEHLEASLWGQSVKLATGSILPLLLIGLLGWNTYLLHENSQAMGSATNAAAQFTTQEIRSYLDREIIHMRAQHAERGREHDAILQRMNETIGLQNTMFLEMLNKKSLQDTTQHNRIETAIVRACRAQDKTFKESRLTHLAERAEALRINAAYIAHLYQKERP